MKITYVYSACLEIETSNLRILTDPWFTEGIFGGSWFQYPRIDPFDLIKEPDCIYISHIHPDHYDPIFIQQIFERYGRKPILIPEFKKNYLFMKAKSDGIETQPIKEFTSGNTKLFIEENDMGSLSDIDSALIVHDLDSKQIMLNLNDCVFNLPHAMKLKSIIDSLDGELGLMALGYAGASSYPHTYFDIEKDLELMIKEANYKKQKGFERYKSFKDFFNAKYRLPFAGEYLLGSHLSHLNHYRGVPDTFEIKDIDHDALVLNPGGSINLESGSRSHERKSLYPRDEIDMRIKEISNMSLDYEKDFCIDCKKIDFFRIIKKAFNNALSKSEITGKYAFIFTILDQDIHHKRFLLNCSDGELSEISENYKCKESAYSEILIDYRLLFGLLTGLYHWNNADIGSLFMTRRFPYDNFNRSAQSFLNFFSIV